MSVPMKVLAVAILFSLSVFGMEEGMDWFNNLRQKDKDNAIQLLSQAIERYNGFNQEVLMDMENKFKISSAQTQQLYKFMYSTENIIDEEDEVVDDEEKDKLIEYLFAKVKIIDEENEVVDDEERVFHDYVNLMALKAKAMVDDEEKDKLIEYLMKKNCQKFTVLLMADRLNDYKSVMKLLVTKFSETEKDKLIEYVEDENDQKFKVLYTPKLGKNVKLLLSEFSEEEKDKLIKILMKKNDKKATILHVTSFNEHANLLKHCLHL